MKHVRDDIVDSVVFHKNMRQPHWLKLPNCNVMKNIVQRNVSHIVRRSQRFMGAHASAAISLALEQKGVTFDFRYTPIAGHNVHVKAIQR